jgi:hypothetical protein
MPKEQNIWVDNLVGLYQNSILGNADNRGLDSTFARESYIETALDAKLLPAIIEGKFKAVFLTGNPGDGKTAFLEKVHDQFKVMKAEILSKDASGWQIKSSGKEYIACYDASESFKGMSSDERLMHILKPFAGNNEPATNHVVLMAINDGKLHSFFHHHWNQFRWLSPIVLEKPLNDQKSDVVVVNLKERALIDINFDEEKSIFDRLLIYFTDPSKWNICQSCSSKDQCPIIANASALGWNKASKQARARLKLLFALSHIRRRRHNTMRDIRSALSYIITGNLRCQTVHELIEHEKGSSLIQKRYFNSIFCASDEALNEFQELDPASSSIPKLDRTLSQIFNQKRSNALSDIFINGNSYTEIAEESRSAIQWIASIRRLIFFEAETQKLLDAFEGIQDPWDLLPYRHLKMFAEFLMDGKDSAQLKQQLGRGISQLEGIRDGNLAKKFILIRVMQSAKEGLTICREFPLIDFELSINPNNQSYVEEVSDRIIIKHITSGIQCVVTLDVFELLLRMSYGLLPGSDEQQVVLDEIAEFKSRLHRIQTKNLLLIESNGQVHHITQQDGRIIRTQEVKS